jgi:hypothetical protein
VSRRADGDDSPPLAGEPSAAAEGDLHAREELLQAERLHDVVGRAGLEPGQPSRSKPRAVSRSTGIVRRSGFAFRRPSTAKPSTSGYFPGSVV